MTDEMVKAIMRKRGELDLTTKQLSKITGVSQWTLSAIFHGKRNRVNRSTVEKLNKWLYQQI